MAMSKATRRTHPNPPYVKMGSSYGNVRVRVSPLLKDAGVTLNNAPVYPEGGQGSRYSWKAGNAPIDLIIVERR